MVNAVFRCVFRHCAAAAAVTLLAGICGAPADAADAAKPRSVRDLRYGVVLYDFYQDDYFQALTEIMLGEQKQDLPHDGQAAALLRGGISLSYGMDDEARAIFNRLLAHDPQPTVRDRAWFYLGKSYYQRGDYTSAQDLLGRSGNHLPAVLAEERDYLKTNIALQRGEAATLPVADDAAAAANPWLPYLIYNLGVVRAAHGDTAGAAQALERLATLPMQDAEHKALRDRAYTAAGYNYLKAGDSAQALAALSKVRVDSPLADKALLGYGWAYAQRKDYADALRPWQALTQRSVLLPAVQEGLLAVPYAYEQLGAPAQALDAYAHAEQLLLREMQHVQTAEQQLQTASLLSLWLPRDERRDWRPRNAELPIDPQVPYLDQLLARNDIQEIIRDMRDLHTLEGYLGAWVDRLDALYTAQSLQYQRRQQLLHDRPDRTLQQGYEQLQARRDALAKRLQDAVASGDGAALMTDRQIAAAARLQKVRDLIAAQRAAGRDVDDQAEQYRRLRGLLLWQVQDQFPVQRWQAQRALQALDRTLADNRAQHTRLEQLVQRAQQPEQSAHIHALAVRLEGLLTGIRSAEVDGELILRRRAIAEMERQRQRLQLYLDKTRLAMARLYDKGATEADTPAPGTAVKAAPPAETQP